MTSTSRIHVDLTAIQHNVGVIRRIIGPGCGVCAMIKADAYGLGAVRVGKTLVSAGVDMLAVYTPDQAAALARAALDIPILVMMPITELQRTDDLYRAFICGRLHMTVHDLTHLGIVQRLAERYGAVVPVHLEIDTGMSRGGCRAADAGDILERISTSRRLRLAGISTHFAAAESDEAMTARQLRAFERVLEDDEPLIPADCLVHLANSYAMLRHQRFHASMVRVGLAWAGYGLEFLRGGECIAEGESLVPCLRWTSTIIHTRDIPAGATVGYGGQWTAQRPTRLGLVPVGYADGYPLRAGVTDRRPRGAMVGVLLDDAFIGFVPVVGAVNMDQLTIDLTDIVDVPGSVGSRAGVGTTVELISPDRAAPNDLAHIAAVAGTIPHELICRLHPRIERRAVIDAPSSPESGADGQRPSADPRRRTGVDRGLHRDADPDSESAAPGPVAAAAARAVSGAP
ncbi:MAG: alanine racemase [Phycisphaerales bacterium]|nr:alanine racemase [Phycisphaerales bacterium]